MADFDKLVENFFKKKENILEINELNKIIHDFYNKPLLKEFVAGDAETVTVDKILKLFPTFKFSQKVGAKKGNINRTEYEKILKAGILSIGPLEEKIKYLENFSKVGGEEKIDINTPMNQILSNLMLLKTLEEVRNDFTPSTAGYMFESFMSILLGGTLPKGNPLQDIVVSSKKKGQEFFSLKVIDSNTPVKGSIKNAAKFFQENPGKSITYIIIYKQDNSIEFLKMKLSKEQFESLIGVNFDSILKNKDDGANKPVQTELPLEEKQQLLEAQQFRIKKDVVEKNSEKLGIVNLNTQQVMEKYGEILKGKLYNTFVHLAELTDNINKFYINNDTSAAGLGAQKAKQLELDLTSGK
jgi:hypothetical protein